VIFWDPKKRKIGLALHFEIRLSDNLLNVGRNEKKSHGRPSVSPMPSPQPKKSRSSEHLPFPETRLDQVGHFPMYGNNKLRCKKVKRDGKTLGNVMYTCASLLTQKVVLLNSMIKYDKKMS